MFIFVSVLVKLVVQTTPPLGQQSLNLNPYLDKLSCKAKLSAKYAHMLTRTRKHRCLT